MSRSQVTSWPFMRLYVLAFLFFSANPLLTVIVPLRSEALGASNAMIGWIMGTYMLACMFFRPWAGQIVKRYGAVKVLRVLLLVNGLALLLYPLTGLGGYFAARFIQGVATAFFSMALQIAIIDSLSEEERSQGVSLYSLFTYMPTIAGPLIAFGIWEWGGMNAFTAAMIIIAVGTGLFGFGTSVQPRRQPEQEANSAQAEEGMLRAMGRVFTMPALSLSVLLMLGASIVFGAVTVFIPLYAQQVAYGNAGVYLMIQACVIVLARYTLRKRIPSDGAWHSRFVLAVLASALISAALLASAVATGPAALYTAAVLMGLAQALLYPTLTTYLTFALPGALRNVLLGLFIASADLGISMGGMAMGIMADKLSYSGMYAVCSGLLLVLIVAERLIHSRLPRPTPRETASSMAQGG